jgi:hypothetical protein
MQSNATHLVKRHHLPLLVGDVGDAGLNISLQLKTSSMSACDMED